MKTIEALQKYLYQDGKDYALLQACKNNDLSMVKIMLAKGAKPSTNTVWWAVRYGNVGILLELMLTGIPLPEDHKVALAVLKIDPMDSELAKVSNILRFWGNPKTHKIASLLYKNEALDAK